MDKKDLDFIDKMESNKLWVSQITDYQWKKYWMLKRLQYKEKLEKLWYM